MNHESLAYSPKFGILNHQSHANWDLAFESMEEELAMEARCGENDLQ